MSVPIGATSGSATKFTAKLEVTSNVLSTVFTFPYAFATVTETVLLHLVSK